MRLALDAVANLLVHPRHRHEDRRLHGLHRLLELVELWAVRQRYLIAHQCVVQVPCRHMREWQERDASIRLVEPERLRR